MWFLKRSAIVLLILATAWVISYGTLDLCGGMRQTAYRIAREQYHDYGGRRVATTIDLHTQGFTTMQCLATTARLYVSGTDTVKRILEDEEGAR
jgi:hypothetical protein